MNKNIILIAFGIIILIGAGVWAFSRGGDSTNSATINQTRNINVTNSQSQNTNAASSPTRAEGTTELVGDTVLIFPTSRTFVYDHSNPTCPLPIGVIDITGPLGSTWAVAFGPDGQPIWLDVNMMTGTAGTPLELSFPCELDEYKNQTQQTDITVNVYDTAHTLLGSQIINVSGEFKNF